MGQLSLFDFYIEEKPVENKIPLSSVTFPNPVRSRIGTSELAHWKIPGERAAICGSKPAPNSRGWFGYPETEGGTSCEECRLAIVNGLSV